MPARPSDLVRVPHEVDWVMAVALAKDERDRFVSSSELARALERAQAGEIDPDHRSRAERLIAERPWGAMQ